MGFGRSFLSRVIPDDGRIYRIQATSFEGTPATDHAELQRAVESFRLLNSQPAARAKSAAYLEGEKTGRIMVMTIPFIAGIVWGIHKMMTRGKRKRQAFPPPLPP